MAVLNRYMDRLTTIELADTLETLSKECKRSSVPDRADFGRCGVDHAALGREPAAMHSDPSRIGSCDGDL